MSRRRYVLRHRGPEATSSADVERARHLVGLTVLEESTSKMMLVECEEEAVAALADTLPGWVVAPDQSYAVPDTRKHLP